VAFESLDFVYQPSRDVKADVEGDPPILVYRVPGGQRIAVSQLTRPGAAASFEGRRVF
jgi:hypothetical protein